MIGIIQGKVIFSDGLEVIINTSSGIGYQVYYNKILAEGSTNALFISHYIKEGIEDLYGFSTLREKKMFELLLSVKGVGAKGAFSLVSNVGTDQIINAIVLESKKVLTKAPGIGPKAAAQMILDLSGKVQKIKMYSDKSIALEASKVQATQMNLEIDFDTRITEPAESLSLSNDQLILDDTVLACKELGFKEDKIMPMAQKILAENSVSKAEQLIHLVLKQV